MLKRFLLVAAVVIIALLAFATTRPDSFQVERWAGIKADREQVFALVDDFHNWREWSPWENLDPNMKRTYSGAASGRGAVYEWSGNSKIGQGRMEIIESVSPNHIKIKLDFLRPMEGHGTAQFTFYYKDGMTKTNWQMGGPLSYPGKVISVFISMDKMIGGDFEQGLINLKSTAEAKASNSSPASPPAH